MLSKEEMSRHRGYCHLPRQAILEDRLLYLLGLDTHAGEEEATNLLRRHGFNNRTFYWDDLNPLFQLSTKHMGCCIVEFPDSPTRDCAMTRLQGVEFKSGRVVTRLPRRDDKNEQHDPSSSSVIPAAPAASTPSANTAKFEGQYPEAYTWGGGRSAELIRNAVIEKFKQLEEESKAQGRPISYVAKDKDGVERIRSTRTSSPAPFDANAWPKMWIEATKVQAGKREVQKITVEELPRYEAIGWEEWHKAARPTEGDIDKGLLLFNALRHARLHRRTR
ncbi:Hypothetical protein NCS54_00663900 [Fusarium falciforme]|uniref:Hypothetical protein n=1 Tax=Fusarium falciforme TaxID=195108 RepID=UPI00230051B5|nr:Hypothetical protein NCS54_00663900 [Fusarium falciforme]WAO89254.1 Hypothetical protein NCS54_00663900 [Fusarium falciforme]